MSKIVPIVEGDGEVAALPMQEARKRSRSFRKLCSEWMTQITEHEG